MNRVLILGGTAEAVSLATALIREPDTQVIYSLAGRTRTPALPDCAVRQGGFGGIEGLILYLRENHIDALVDAAHPYAAQMAAHARAASAVAPVPLFKFLRPAWEEPAGAPWRHAATPADAADIIDGAFRRVFLSTGLGDLDAFSHLAEVWFLVRSVDLPQTPIALSQCHHLAARGPFSVEKETELLRQWRIDALVTKNSGGTATVAKLEAAYDLGIPIIMIDRPEFPGKTSYADTAELMDAVLRHFS